MDVTKISDERLAALADGELPAEEAAALRAAIAGDETLAERFALFVETRELLAPEPRAAADAGHDRLAAAIRAADRPHRPALSVVEGGGPARPAPRATPQPRLAPRFRVAAPALAACLALAVGGLLGFEFGRGGTTTGSAGGIAAVPGAPGADVALASALERTPSGEKLSWTDDAARLHGAVSIVSTHRLDDGRLCREYEVSVDGRDGGVVGLGCRRKDGGWLTEALARNAGGSDYATASGLSVIEGAIERLGGHGALSETEERDLIAKNWKALR